VMLCGAAGFCARPLAATADPAAPSAQAANDNTWVEPAADVLPGNAMPPEGLIPPGAAGANNPAEPIVEAPQVGNKGAGQSLGRPDVAPIVEIRTTYDDNIYYTPTDKKSDVYTTVVAGLAVGWGDFRDRLEPLGSFQEAYEKLRTPDFDARQFLYASYTPGYTAFIKYPGEDTLDQNANVGARWLFGSLTCDLRANYRYFSDALADTGTRSRESQLDIALNSRYDFSDKTSAEVDLNMITHHYDNNSLVGSTELIDENYLNYQVLPKTSISAGATLGYLSEEEGPNQTYEQALARVVYVPDREISANLFGGVEFRQFSGGFASLTDPVFGASVTYSPFDDTAITVAGSRVVTSSAEYVGQDIKETNVSIKCTQLLFDKVTLTLGGAYGSSDYVDDGQTGDIHRDDDTLQLQGSISFHMTMYMAVSLSYYYSHNDSSLETYTFVDNRAVIDFDLLF